MAVKKKVEEIPALVVNIKYSPTHFFREKKDIEDCPDSMEITIPEKVLEQKNRDDFWDIVESFVYNLISAMTGRCVTHCQIWLEDE